MATYKCTWFFEGLQSNPGRTASAALGWTETWYLSAATVDAALAEAARNAPDSWIGRRRIFLNSNYVIRWVRASLAEPPYNQTKVTSSGVPGGGLLAGVAEAHEGVTSQVTCCVLVDFVALPIVAGERTHHRRTLFRGLNSGMIDGNVIDEASASYTAMLNFCSYIGRGQIPPVPAGPLGQWLIRFQDVASPYVPIAALAQVAGNSRQVNLTAGLPLAARRQLIQVSGVQGMSPINRVWTVQAPIAAGGPYQLGTAKTAVLGAWAPGSGQARFVSPLFRAPSQYLVIGLRVKRTGRPFRLTRGRRRVPSG